MAQQSSLFPALEPSRALRCFISAAIVLLVVSAVRPIPLEDGYIYARYIRNDLGGLGLVFNPGEHINALTSPLYSFILLNLTRLVHGHILLCEYLLFTTFFIAACCLMESFFPWSGIFLASMTTCYSVIGMETTLFVFLILLSIWVIQKEHYNSLPLCLLLLALTRSEGAAMIPVAAWILFRRKRWPSWHAYVLPLLVVIGYLVLNHQLYGTLLPASSTAKIGQGKSGFWGKWPRAFLYGYRMEPAIRPAFWALLPLIAALPRGLNRLRNTPWQQAALPFFLILCTFYVLFNIPAYNWYYVPLTMIVVVFGVAGITSFRWGTAVVIFLSLLQIADTARLQWTRRQAAMQADPYVAAATWLNTHTAQDATVECLEIGQFGWRLDRYLYDSLGLTLPKNAEHVAHRDFSSWLEEDKPDYVLYHTTRPFPFERVIIADANYTPVTEDTLGIVIYKRTRDFGKRGIPPAMSPD